MLALTPDLMLILRCPLCGSWSKTYNLPLTTFLYLFTMSSLHLEALDEHADVDQDHVDKGSELNLDVPC